MSVSGDGAGESFRGLILRLRGRVGLTQRELAARLEVHQNSVQAWEAGTSYPGVASLRALIEVALRAGAFTAGHEMAEASAIWEAVAQESSRLRAPFDRAWFNRLLTEQAVPAGPSGPTRPAGSAPAPVESAPPIPSERPAAPVRRQSWSEAPDVAGFLGRGEEREILSRWVLDEHCRVVGLLGLGGIGKTLLASRLAHDVAPHFTSVYWRSLRDAQAPGEWLAGALAFLAPDDAPVAGEAAQLTRLLALLHEQRCLLVLDNLETVLRADSPGGGYAIGNTGYGSLLRQIGEVPHQSCLVLTSREAPPELGVMRGETGPVRRLDLGGLSVADGQSLLDDKRLTGDVADWRTLVASCGGNGLALKVTGETIRDLFGGSIAAYLDYASETPGVMLGGVRQLIAAQIQRLTELERELLRWLAIEREPVSFAELAAGIGARTGRGATLEAVEGLRRRSLLERGERRASFTLHPVVLEFVTEQLIDEAARELSSGELDLLLGQPLVKATARDYVRRSQERLIATPILAQLVATSGSRERATQRLLALLDQLRRRQPDEQGYGPGNVVNLLWLLRGDLRKVDLSGLHIRQAFLQGVEAQHASLARAHLVEVVLAEAFKYPTAVTLSADGAYLAAGTSASEVCLWRVADRTLLATLHGHTAGIRGIALSDDNRMIASGSFDGTVRLWDAESGELLAIMRGHEGLVYAVTLRADGLCVASGGQDGTVKLWDAATGQLLVTLAGHDGGVWGVALSDDGRLVASASTDGTVRLWEAASGRLLRALAGHTAPVHGVAFSRDGLLVASGSLDGTVRLWQTDTGEALLVMRGHTGGVRDVALSDDGRLVASGSLDGTVRLWEAESGRPLSILRGHVGLVYTVALNGEGKLVASGSFDGSVKLWDTASGRLIANLQGYNRGIRSVATDRAGRLLASGGFDGIVRIWDTTDGRLLTVLAGHASGIRGVAMSGDGQLVVSGAFDGSIKLWDTASGRDLATLPGHTGGVWGVALSGDGRLVASGGYDGDVKLWDAKRGGLLATLSGHTGGLRAVALSGDGRLAASGGEDKTVRLWDTASGRLLTTFDEHAGGIWDVALSDDGRLVASASDDRTVRIWETASGQLVSTLVGHDNSVWGVALTEDGRMVVSASFDGSVRLWETASGREVSTMRGHDGRVVAVTMDAGGRLAASAGADGTVRIWDAQSGALRQTLQSDRRYERLDITGLTGITEAQRDALLALGAVEQSGDPAVDPAAATAV
jgi:WD40 repeat protein/transcriptional regulator with XRE-family HTH domain